MMLHDILNLRMQFIRNIFYDISFTMIITSYFIIICYKLYIGNNNVMLIKHNNVTTQKPSILSYLHYCNVICPNSEPYYLHICKLKIWQQRALYIVLESGEHVVSSIYCFQIFVSWVTKIKIFQLHFFKMIFFWAGTLLYLMCEVLFNIEIKQI